MSEPPATRPKGSLVLEVVVAVAGAYALATGRFGGTAGSSLLPDTASRVLGLLLLGLAVLMFRARRRDTRAPRNQRRD